MAAVSVIIPTHNRGDLLRHAITSVLVQSRPPQEIIVVDDGSTDDTSVVCEAFGAAVRYIWQPNSGPSRARNVGIQAARCDFVAFLDSDDRWLPTKLEVQLAAMHATQADWSITDFAIVDDTGAATKWEGSGFEYAFPVFKEAGRPAAEHFRAWLPPTTVRVGGRAIVVYAGDVYGLLFRGNVALPSTAIVARHVFAAAGTFDEALRLAEDTDLFQRLAAVSRGAIVADRLTEYRVGHPSLISVGDRSPAIESALRSMAKVVALRPLRTDAERSAFKVGSRQLLLRLAYARLANLDPRGARAALTQLRRTGEILGPRGTAIFLLSFVPVSALHALHRLKRLLRTALP